MKDQHPGVERLSGYLDAGLEAAAAAAVETHLRDCSACSRHFEELLAVDALARALPLDAPRGYFDAFPGRVRARLQAHRSARQRVPVWAWAAAAGVLLAVLTPMTLKQGRQEAVRAPAAVPALPTGDATSRAGTPPPVSVVDEEPARISPATPGERRLPQGPGVPAREEAGEEDRAQPFAAPPMQAASGEGPRQGVGPLEERPAEATADGALPPAAEAEPLAAGRVAETPKAAADRAPARDSFSPRGRARGRTLPVPPGATLTDAQGEASVENEFVSLGRRVAQTADEARVLRDDWLRFARTHPHHAESDEAWVRAIEWGALAYRLGGHESDRLLVESEGAAYLRGEEARQQGRVRALLDGLQP